MKRLSTLLVALPDGFILHGHDGVDITAPVVESTLELLPGGVFVARRGLTVDGHRYIPQAVERGAAAVVGEQEITGLPIPYIQVPDAQAALGYLAAAYHDFPSHKLVVIGVTGTDGKTTTSTLIHSVFKHATGGKAGYISTIAADLGDSTADTGLHVTTPGAPQVQAYLAQMVANGLTHCVLEMTSHGLAQGRLNGVALDAAVLTNITHEHLDYHGTFENYRAAKALMFHMLAASPRKPDVPKISVVNADDPNAAFFTAIPADQVITYGIQNAADYQADAVEYRPDGTVFRVGASHIVLSLVGGFNVLNALAAVAVGRSFGLPEEAIQAGVAAVKALSGRMERIDEGQDFTAIVDFAHTPNALLNALKTARQLTSQRVIAVFGSAGLRDVEKRRLMAEVAAEWADFTIFTAEDPRTESLEAILQMMADGATSKGGVEGETFIRVPDRGEALYRACQMARAGDVVMACGKGHEQSMCFGTVEHPWDDRDALRAALRGAPLRTLPTAG
ncbi:MAG: UDP-N-acetylmuramoyl-L-alanyl-D-glutamate--2,6-diaminopimelate ligase [Anaerolineae bacterium]